MCSDEEKGVRSGKTKTGWTQVGLTLCPVDETIVFSHPAQKEDDTVVPEHSDDHCDLQVEDIWAQSGCARLCCCLARAPSWDT